VGDEVLEEGFKIYSFNRFYAGFINTSMPNHIAISKIYNYKINFLIKCF
jgi:hypothetical protein